MKLENGSCVCIIGGGPAGCFAAINLLRFAAELNLSIEVLIFEYRDGSRTGPAGCKGCAGILSSTLVKNLVSIGVIIPDDLILDEINSYILYIPNIGDDVIHIDKPDDQRHIYSISRGGGPRMAPSGVSPSFDEFLRNEALRSGAKIINERVKIVEHGDFPVVITGSGKYKADLVVLASGVNSSKILDPAFGYQPPETVSMVQGEFLKPGNNPPGTVAAFFGEPEEIFFGTLVPKGKYMNVSLFGKHWKGMRNNAVAEFMKAESSRMKDYYPEFTENLCGCNPKIIVKMSEKYYGDRWVAVGDAAVCRLYKDGIGSAFITSRGAMRSAVVNGISCRDFKKGYRGVCRSFLYDNIIGKALFSIFAFMLGKPLIALSIKRCVLHEKDYPPEKKVFSILIWGMLTGDYSYKFLLGRVFNIRCVLRFLRRIFFGFGRETI